MPGISLPVVGNERKNKNCKLLKTDTIIKKQILFDTGAENCLVPSIGCESRNRVDKNFFKANRTKITTFEKKTLNVNIVLRRQYSWSFTIADVDMTIIIVSRLG